MLKRVELKSFKGFKDFVVSLNPDISVLVGPNNAGKTTIVGAIRLCAALVDHAKRWNPGDRNAATFGRPHAYSITDASLSLAAFNSENVYHDFLERESVLIFDFESGARMEVEWPPSGDPVPDHGFFTIQYPTTSSRATAVVRAKQYLPSIGVVPTLTPVEGRERLVTARTVRLNYTTRLASSHFRNQLWRVHEELDGSWEDLRTFILENTPEISDFRIEGTYIGASDDALDLYFREASSGQEREITWAGDGMQVWCQVLFHLWRERDKDCLVLDEPDVYLHPDLQRRLVSLVRNMGRQIVLATHSVEALNELGHESAIAINRQLTGAARFSGNGAMAEYAGLVGSGIQLGLARALTRPVVLFVEGQDLSILRIFAQTLGLVRLASEQGLAVIPLGGFSRWPDVAGFSRILKQAGPGPKIFVLLDRDDRSNSAVSDIVDQVAKDGAVLHVWQRKEIENYLLSAKVIAQISGLSREEIEAMMTHTAAALKEESLARWLGRRQRDSSKAVDPGTVAARALKDFSKRWDDDGDFMAIVSGKTFLKSLNREIASRKGRSCNAHSIARAMGRDDIDQEVIAFLETIENALK